MFNLSDWLSGFNGDVQILRNDIVMAAATGAIRRYCIYKGDMKLKESKAVEFLDLTTR